MGSIGSRVLEQIEQVCPGDLHRDIAMSVGMTPDAFSRALNGKRRFSSLELALVAQALGADLHWLITGRPDLNRLTVAARHNFDHITGRRDVPGRSDDERTIQDIALAYRQAYQEPAQVTPLPEFPDEIRGRLGGDFVRLFADRLEAELDVGVVRVTGLSTAYSFTVGGRRVIAIPSTGNWFRENWDIAHELGHLAQGHHDDGLADDVSAKHEAAANSFAAGLLLPEDVLCRIEWDGVTEACLAQHLWDWGVSTDALARRLANLLVHVPERVAYWAAHPTQRLLRRHLATTSTKDEITQRMDDAAQRRFPVSLQEAHVKGIASGALGKGTLAWMLGLDAEALDVDTPDSPGLSPDDLAAALGL